MAKDRIYTNSYDYIYMIKNGIKDFIARTDFNKNATKREKTAEQGVGIGNFARKHRYENDIFSFMEDFNPEMFLKDFAQKSDEQRLSFLQQPQNGKALTSMIFIAEHSEELISDIKYIAHEKGIEGFNIPNDFEKNIRLHAQLYKPVVETIICISDPERYKAGELPFAEPKRTKGNRAGKHTSEDVYMGDDAETMERKEKLYSSIQKNFNLNSVSNDTVMKNGKMASEAISYLVQQKQVKKLNPDAVLNENNKADFEKSQLNMLCDALKKTDPDYIMTNSAAFKKMRDGFYKFRDNFDKMDEIQRKSAAAGLKKLTNDYITPRTEKYKDGEMNPRSNARFEIAEKFSALCDLCKSDFKTMPEFVNTQALKEKTMPSARTAENKADYTKNRPILPQ